jgi:NAD(P)-dependent dehydrogenase (short-subunit alcohol dehydrogenase family)
VAAKHGLVGLTKTATFEYAAQNLRLNASFLPDPITPWMADIWRSKVETKKCQYTINALRIFENMLSNPFTPSEIAGHAENFFGRSEELRLIGQAMVCQPARPHTNCSMLFIGSFGFFLLQATFLYFSLSEKHSEFVLKPLDFDF